MNPQNPTDADIQRAFACWCVRQVWPIVMREGFPFTQAVLTAEQFVNGQCSARTLEFVCESSCAWRGTPLPSWFSIMIKGGCWAGAARHCVREAARSTCVPDAEDSAERTSWLVAWALACSAVELLEPEMRSEAMFNQLLAPEQRRHDAVLKGHLANRSAATVEEQFFPLEQSDSLVWFAVALWRTSSSIDARPVANAEQLLALALAHPKVSDLWAHCHRADWMAWLLQCALDAGFVEDLEISGVAKAFNLTGDEAIQRRRATQLRGIERVQTAIEQFRVNRLDLHRQTIRYGLHEPDRRASLTTFVGHFINGGLPDLSKSLPHRIEVYTVEEGNSRGLTLYCKQCVDGRAGASVTVLFDGRGYACKGCGHRFVTD